MVVRSKSRSVMASLIILSLILVNEPIYTINYVKVQGLGNKNENLTPYQVRAVDRFLHIIRDMKPASSDTNEVLVGIDALKSEESRFLNITNRNGLTLSLTSLKTRLQQIIILLSEFNETSYQLIEQGINNYWDNPLFISDPSFNRTTFYNDLQIFALSYLAFSYGRQTNGSAIQFQFFINNYTLEERVNWLKLKMIGQKIPVFFVEFLFSDGNILDIARKANNYLKELFNEVNAHNRLKVTSKVTTNVQISVTVNHQGIAILSDPDSSVSNNLDLFQTNQTTQNQPFSGDEALVLSHLGIKEERIEGIVSVDIDWEYEDGSSASKLMNYAAFIVQNGYRGLEFIYQFGRNATLLKFFASTTNATYNGSYQNFSPFFDVEQIRINSFILSQENARKLDVKELDIDIFEHHWVGMFVFNDTNNNGLMDIETMISNETGDERPVFSNETLYRFDGVAVENVTLIEPQAYQDSITFGFTCNNLTGILAPFATSPELANFNRSFTPSERISSFGVQFNFSVSDLDQTAKLKFNFEVGEWNNTEVLSGLSLNQLFTSVYTRTEKQPGLMKDGKGNSIDFNTNTILETSEFTYYDENSVLARFELSSLPYLWNDSTISSTYGQQTPLLFIDITQSESTTIGQNIQDMKRMSKNVFLSSINYPNWDGLSIIHDPTFEVSFGEGDIIEWAEETAKILLKPASLILAATITLLLGLIAINKRLLKKNS